MLEHWCWIYNFCCSNASLNGYIAQDSVGRHHKARTWAPFFMAKLGVASFIFQAIHLTSICLAIWRISIAARIMWFMAPFGTLANLRRNIWRTRIFGYVLPETLNNLIQLKFLVPALSTCFLIFIWIFNPFLYSSSGVISKWANAVFPVGFCGGRD
jgi:hypothetical protein